MSLFLLGCAIGFAVGRFVGAITVGVCAAGNIANLEAANDRLRDAIHSRTIVLAPVKPVRDSRGRFASVASVASSIRPEVQG